MDINCRGKRKKQGPLNIRSFCFGFVQNMRFNNTTWTKVAGMGTKVVDLTSGMAVLLHKGTGYEDLTHHSVRYKYQIIDFWCQNG